MLDETGYRVGDVAARGEEPLAGGMKREEHVTRLSQDGDYGKMETNGMAFVFGKGGQNDCCCLIVRESLDNISLTRDIFST